MGLNYSSIIYTPKINREQQKWCHYKKDSMEFLLTLHTMFYLYLVEEI